MLTSENSRISSIDVAIWAYYPSLVGKGVQMKISELLGPLELTVMEVMWRVHSATVRQVHQEISAERSLAYTTVLTVMTNLTGKQILERDEQGKSHVYSVSLTQEEFIDRECSRAVSDLLERFGDLAVASFLQQSRRSRTPSADSEVEHSDS